MKNYPNTILCRPAQFVSDDAFIWFDNRQREAAFRRDELERLAALYPDGRLRLDSNGKGRLYVRLSRPDDGKAERLSVSRILESVAGNGDLVRREVRYRNRDTLDLRPENRVISKRGPLKGNDSTYQDAVRRSWTSNNSARTFAVLNAIARPAFSPRSPVIGAGGGNDRQSGADE